MEIHHSAVILLLILSVFFSCHGQPDEIKEHYKHFLIQHYGPKMTVQKCTSEIKKREITGSDGDCKDVNTFIKANSDQIRAVCGEGGILVSGSLYRSLNPFPVITCKLQSGKRPPKCDYYKGKRDTRYIVLGCAEGWPVHYEEGIPVPRDEESPVDHDEDLVPQGSPDEKSLTEIYNILLIICSLLFSLSLFVLLFLIVFSLKKQIKQ